ncbi:aldose epimerase family protein [Aerococcus urinaeequi]|uniref:aldose epimerase family protein n=1 Tax=Aerococcus urinaeequi TaxID=51665 RepID=UPI0007411FE1|nr:aldose epimerase family protein [Aerococcus urinaeequi]MCY7730570.1 galactose mutarotase [Aerococcus urinaeequi]MDT2762094.1 galactose mutarotase [Aerococcus urinaeequi]
MQHRILYFGDHNDIHYSKIILTNDQQVSITLTDLGARILAFLVPNEDRSKVLNIVDGYDSVQDIFDLHDYYLGATVGRVAGRIASGQFTLEGQSIQLDKNDGAHHLHGGTDAIDLKKWDFRIEEGNSEISVVFELEDADGHNGYPGNMYFQVCHTLNNKNEWSITYNITTDKTTIVNPTNHVYFNLDDEDDGIKNHFLQINADKYLPIDYQGIPINEKGANVEGSVFDFRKEKLIVEVLEEDTEQIQVAKGIDHPFILNENNEEQLKLSNSTNNLAISVVTDAACVVVYTFNYPKAMDSKRGLHHSVALETQSLPNAINFEKVPETIYVSEDRPFYSKTTYKLIMK